MQILAGITFGSLIALFFMAFGMAIQRKIDGKDEDDAR